MRIVSTTALVPASPEVIAKHLSDLRNLHSLLPLDQINEWQATEDSCSFKIKGGIIISLEHKLPREQSKIEFKSGASSPFPFTLTVHLAPKEDFCEGNMEFNAKVNPFVKLVAEKPLTGLFENMTQKLKDYFNQKQS